MRQSGDPVPAEAMAKLFQPFLRGEVRAGQQGLGLGLHIATEIAKAHGDTIAVYSSAVETQFTFRMPLNRPPTAIEPEDRFVGTSREGLSFSCCVTILARLAGKLL